MVRYDAALPLSQRLGRRIKKFFGRKPPHVAQWLAAGDSYGTAFSLLQTYAQPLLNLVTSEEFLAGERSGLPFLR